MPGVSLEAIKDLREQTSAGVMDCKNALEEAGGDTAKAVELLRQKGLSIAAKKSSRDTLEGVVESYIHTGNRVGAIVEVNCETDFVARTPEFKELAHNLAMQVAAMSPRYVDGEVPAEDEADGGEGLLLMEQAFIKDPSCTIRDVVNDVMARVGENIRVRRFQRFALGEEPGASD
jgi:elongation factor Ts